jgi:serine/threonine protein kinase
MADLLVEKEFAGYRIDRRVGRGGMGVVYQATDLALDRTVALKVLAEELAEDDTFRRRFIGECKIAASLDHPNVVPIYGAGEHDGRLWLAMRFVFGDDLRTIMRTTGGRLEPGRAARIVALIAAALDAAHERGLVHRDVKPANVLVTPDDHVYLSDFGLSKRLTALAEHTRTGEVVGTLDYLAPEQIRSEPLTPSVDIYALGCVAYHLLTGCVPFPGQTQEAKLWAQLSEPQPVVSEQAPELGTAFDEPVWRAMAKAPEDRPAQAGVLGRELVAAAEGRVPERVIPAKARSKPKPKPKPKTRPAAAAPRGLKTTVVKGGAPAPAGPAPAPGRTAVLVLALREPFNLAVLALLVAAGLIFGAGPPVFALAAVVYAAGVARSYFDADIRERARDG